MCAEGGAPGSAPAGFEFGLYGAILQSLVCWGAMGLLPWATPKGGKLYEVPKGVVGGRQPIADSSITTKGGRLWYFMWYDTLILLACAGGVAFAWFGTEEPDHIVRARTYHIKMLYSVLTLPWLLLKLPLAYTLVLHLKPTGYNKQGQVVRLCNAKERKAARDKRLGLKVAVAEAEVDRAVKVEVE